MEVLRSEVRPIRSAQDLVLVRQAVRTWTADLKFSLVEQTKMVTAASELARNTLDYGKGGQVILQIVQEGIRRGLRLSFEDNGPGIPDELKETIFYPLVTGRPTGTGLGLTIAQDLVSRNGGLIEFTSEPGRTVFQIRLPVANGAR